MQAPPQESASESMILATLPKDILWKPKKLGATGGTSCMTDTLTTEPNLCPFFPCHADIRDNLTAGMYYGLHVNCTDEISPSLETYKMEPSLSPVGLRSPQSLSCFLSPVLTLPVCLWLKRQICLRVSLNPKPENFLKALGEFYHENLERKKYKYVNKIH